MAKIFVAYPISYDCNLRCSYCFHQERFETNFTYKRRFTIPDYVRFRDIHLKNPEDIIVHFHGGEPFTDMNTNTICTFMRMTEIERADLLTNGLQKLENYKKILPFKDRINRIGLTFHRKMIAHIPKLVKKYEEVVMFLYEHGVPVYVKELLFTELRDEIREHKRYWTSKGVDFKVQDFKGCDRGRSGEEFGRYEAADYLLIDSEYKHGGEYCSCYKGYKNVLIRGGWNDGDVLACFEDPKIVGNIQRNEYLPDYRIYKDGELGRINVIGVPENYKGTWERDMYKPKQCGSN